MILTTADMDRLIQLANGIKEYDGDQEWHLTSNGTHIRAEAIGAKEVPLSAIAVPRGNLGIARCTCPPKGA